MKTSIIASAFLFHLFVGNFCLVNLASAMMTMMEPEVLSHASETDLLPMSKQEPATCPWTLSDPTDTTQRTSPCESGKCFVPPSPPASCPDLALGELPSVYLPVPVGEDDMVLPSIHLPLRPTADRPPPLIATAMVVLRQ